MIVFHSVALKLFDCFTYQLLLSLQALSSSDQTAVACVNPLAEYAPVKTDLAGKNDYSPVDHCRISRKCLNFDSNEQRKIKFLAEHSDFFSKIINSAQSEVGL